MATESSRLNLCLNAERQLLARNAPQRHLPVTIVTGFLGAGKTSLLRHILQCKLNLNIACAISDLAAINVDALLLSNQLEGPGHKLFELSADPNGSVKEFRDAVWQVLKAEDDLGFVDYVVVETSGTTDPSRLIAAVEETWGSMTRARLDTVVTVVDGDAVASDVMQGRALCEVAIQQLRCADVVLLNKSDLLNEYQRAVARHEIEKHAPRARVYETDHARVYLPHVLDIAPPDDALITGVSHESVPLRWNTGQSTPTESLRKLTRSAVSSDARVFVAPTFSSVALEQTEPMALGAIHLWLERSLPEGTLRAKGVLYVAELPRFRFEVHWSGNRRLHVENTGEWVGTPQTQFVVIGSNQYSTESGFDKAQVVEKLETCLATIASLSKKEIEENRTASAARLATDERFETLGLFSEVTTIAFQLVCPVSALDETMLRHHHHVNTNELTKRLVREVNASGGGSLLLYMSLASSDGEHQDTYAVASSVGPASVLSMWKDLDLRAQSIVDEVKQKLAGCLCGF
ncbi:hypothetical protein CCR75_009231 [Bremia lactucae]|uniref:CobW C-terminal domain-containing protein n=1 Tax=Bremia lactucae TaxID=4779 RepID=A0A976FNC9_BRELC|nr:hypothetical protein CCR75_009231 [Bremia lactucae]